jgi:transglutaminase-like putative cysteine protease
LRIQVVHRTRYEYDSLARQIIQVLRVTPRSHDGQHVHGWRLDADADVRVRVSEDAYGNIVQSLWTEQPVMALELTVSGEVTTADTAGLVQGQLERLPPPVFLRRTALSAPDPAIIELAQDVAAKEADALARAHALMSTINGAMTFDTDATHTGVSAAEAFALKRGVCQDLSHVFVAAARSLGMPARYVSGHLAREDGAVQEASHAWVEAYIPDAGWVGFDPANGISPTERYVRVAVGLDYLDAAPVRGARNGGGSERLSVRLQVQQVQQ